VKHVGVIVALLLVLAEIPAGVLSADVWSRVYGTRGVATAGGPGDPDSAGALIFRAGVRGDLAEIPRTVQRVRASALAMMGCARCHGTLGLGGPVPVASGSAFAPPITYYDLVAAGYTDAGIGAAIRTGVDSRGRMLSVMMPRWDMDDEELAALLEHLKALSAEQGQGRFAPPR
jgi:mono/diheme cytochrome c family protein